MTGKKIQLFASWFCPFAQRAWIALLEKGVDFEYNEIDPYNKTKEFLAMNPRGLVPVIVDEGKSVYESTVCIQYLDEAWPQGPQLLPQDPYERAQVRIWSQFIDKKIIPKFYTALQRQTEEEQKTAMKSLLDHIEELTRAMSSDGPFFMGKQFGMVDIVLVPQVIRFEVLAHFRGFSIPDEARFARYEEWKKASLARVSVEKTRATREQYIEIYRRYAENTAKSQMAEAIRRGTALP